MHVNPFPWNPTLQAQVNEPGVFVQTAFESHGLFKHSLISVKKEKSLLLEDVPAQINYAKSPV